MKKLVLSEEGPFDLLFYCPACECYHGVSTKEPEPTWNWNNNLCKPTFTPSIRVKYFNNRLGRKINCHFFVKDGKIEYLSDCTHLYASKTVEMRDER